MRTANVRVKYFRVFVKNEGKKSGVCKGSSEDPKEAIKMAMSLKDRTNTVYVKQGWHNPKSCYTGDVKVYEFDGNEIWFEERFSEELKAGKYNA